MIRLIIALLSLMQFSPHGSRIPLVFAEQVSCRNSDGLPLSAGVKQDYGWRKQAFSSFMHMVLIFNMFQSLNILGI